MTSNNALSIKYKLKLKGYSQVDVARNLGVTPTAVWLVIEGRSVSVPIRESIAKIIGESVAQLWPDDDEEERAA